MKARVDANLFRLVYGAVSTEETRYYLNGVHIEAHPEAGAIMVATDGYRMIVARDPEGSCEGGVIVQLPKYVLTQCKPPKMFPAKRLLEIVGDHPGSATLVDLMPGKTPEDEPTRNAILTAHNVLIDGTFPDWRRVVPREPTNADKSAATAFNPRFLSEWGNLGKEIEKTLGMGGAMQISLSDAGSPVVIRWAASNIFAIQMPMRADIRGGFLPDFMKQPAEQLQAAE